MSDRPYNEGNGAREESVGSLLKQLGYEIGALVTKELALFKAEMRENVREVRGGVMGLAAGGAVMLAGLVVLLIAVANLLAQVMQPWLAALLVSAAALLIGYVMVRSGSARLDAQHLKPERTIQSLERDKNTLKEKQP